MCLCCAISNTPYIVEVNNYEEIEHQTQTHQYLGMGLLNNIL